MLKLSFLLLALISSADETDNPEYAAWSRFGEGTCVTTRLSKPALEMQVVTTTTLLTKTARTLELEERVTMTALGKKTELPARKRSVPAKIPKIVVEVGTRDEDSRPRRGREQVKVDGGEFACAWSETTIERGGTKTVARIWTCDEVPGGLVKMTSSTSGASPMGFTLEVTEVVKK